MEILQERIEKLEHKLSNVSNERIIQLEVKLEDALQKMKEKKKNTPKMNLVEPVDPPVSTSIVPIKVNKNALIFLNNSYLKSI